MNKEIKYKLLTYGCQMNDYDSEVISSLVESTGAYPVEKPEDADIIIFNTCCVRESADNKVYGRLGQYKILKKENPNLLIVVAGCLAEKDGEKMIKKFPQVDLVVGPRNAYRIVSLIEQAKKKKIVCLNQDDAVFLNPLSRSGNITGYIPVSVGCDCFCTYCIVPYVRGRLKSRPAGEIVAEAERLVKQGFGEIFLLGQNVNSYGFDLPGKPTFAELLEKINGIDGIRRIRFVSPHPKDFHPDLIKAVGKLENVCKSVHLPMQSGSNRILKLMNRKYDREQYLKIIHGLRKEVPEIALSTDIIVGFPGETNEDFEETLDIVRDVQFDLAFMFAYSPRDGTAAAKIPDQVPHDEKMNHLYRLIEMQNDISRAKNEKFVGQVLECLVESLSKKDPTKLTGRTERNRVVNFTGDKSLIGEFVNVKLTSAFTWGWIGEMAEGG
ncbi:MAG: tRNA (N6-isopentenyl adenosine(37)-C2)-methylthiotransferase MiaB [Candidatus Eremiobacteraeota bacterium]|nr:tRNA (N6-isopentenyl adenosine(37)-C2)-methylthiotransferase MiaB [Candidatus Eremiobacteraeota bacterium]